MTEAKNHTYSEAMSTMPACTNASTALVMTVPRPLRPPRRHRPPRHRDSRSPGSRSGARVAVRRWYGAGAVGGGPG